MVLRRRDIKGLRVPATGSGRHVSVVAEHRLVELPPAWLDVPGSLVRLRWDMGIEPKFESFDGIRLQYGSFQAWPHPLKIGSLGIFAGFVRHTRKDGVRAQVVTVYFAAIGRRLALRSVHGIDPVIFEGSTP